MKQFIVLMLFLLGIMAAYMSFMEFGLHYWVTYLAMFGTVVLAVEFNGSMSESSDKKQKKYNQDHGIYGLTDESYNMVEKLRRIPHKEQSKVVEVAIEMIKTVEADLESRVFAATHDRHYSTLDLE